MALIKKNVRGIFKFTIQMIIVWISAFLILMFFRNFGVAESGNQLPLKEIDLADKISIFIFLGIVTGVLYSGLEIFFDRPYFQKKSFGRLILLKNIFYFITARIIFFLAIIYYAWRSESTLNPSIMIEVMTGKNFWVLLTYFVLVSIFISFTLQISQKFGPGMLWKFLTGKYHHPKEENRIFLFIDLRSSTTIAEQLGHIQFSRLLQDCFFDLTEVISKYQVDIYQYVGDEAVLSWKKREGVTKSRCIHTYFDYMKVLEKKDDYYLKNYGLTPFFKAGIHMGIVTVAEVGVIKKEIAYHGDVLNTAARIQGECNKLGQSFLASEEVIINLEKDQKQFKSKLMETSLLKGKNQNVAIYAIQPV
jgi:adenylate cyclase